MTDPTLLPLEKVLQRKDGEVSQRAHLNESVFQTYTGIVNYLRLHIYPLIDAGLAALSKHSGFYTLHNESHFDEVVKYAGLLLGCEHGDEDLPSLSAYELYVLLVAIRLHDAGNAFGREGHEKRAFQILQEMGAVSGTDNFEKKMIAEIAEAHGGITADGSKDTIGKLRDSATYGSQPIRPRLLAAITRFADEICESRPRAAGQLLKNNALPKHSEVFHKYADCIKSVRVVPNEKTVHLKIAFSVDDVLRTWGKGKDESDLQEVHLIDEIFSRLEKMILERQYCMRFMRGLYNIERIRAEIEIHDDKYKTVIELPVEEEEGYPTLGFSLRERYKDFTGEELINRFNQKTVEVLES